ncbi:uncharacterized protein LOC135124176 isoform X3 [Zophobas morio]|uniref:uncharacterized protein LOC135124176 isoform X3 n=1 Tax=Zophobas morio TaxID=2755281 RepID=UPI003083BFE0
MSTVTKMSAKNEMVFCVIILVQLALVQSVTTDEPEDLSTFINYQPETLPKCPQGFTETSTLCYTVSQESSFPPQCPFENVVPFDSYEHILEKIEFPVWLPVQRDLSNGLGFLLWMELSSRYKTVFDDPFFYTGGIKGKDCLLYHNRSHVEAISCENEHKAICAYEKQPKNHNLCGYCLPATYCKYEHREICSSDILPKNHTLCGNCVQSTLNYKSGCVCVERQNSTYTNAEFLEPFQNNVYDLLENETCAIGLEKTENGTYVWANSQVQLNYSFWAANDNNTGDYVGLSPAGWILTEEPLECSLVQKQVKKTYPSLELDVDSVNYELKLHISKFSDLRHLDSDTLVYCFTDASSFSLLYRYSKLNLTHKSPYTMNYQLSPFPNASGRYWCEGVRSFDLKVVTSNVVLLQNDKFVVIFRLTYHDINPLGPEVVELIKDSLNFSYCPYKISKIVDINEEKQEISVRVHFRCALLTYIDGNVTETNAEVRTLIYSLYTNSSKANLEIMSLWAVDYQLPFSDHFAWLESSADEKTHFSELFSSSEIDTNCSLMPKLSSSTEDFVSIIDERDKEALLDLLLIAENYANFNAMDVYLISQLMRAEWTHFDEFDNVVNNILKVNKHVLMDAIAFSSTDIWFNATDYSNESSYDQTLLQFKFDEDAIENNGCELVLAENHETFITKKKLTIFPNTQPRNAALINRSESPKSANMIIFFNDIFFNDMLLSPSRDVIKSVGEFAIQNVFLTDLNVFNIEIFKGKCMHWTNNWQNNVSSWEFGFACHFPKSNYFASMYQTTFDRTTHTLKQIAECDSTCDDEEIMSILYQISNRYTEFTSEDVTLFGNALKKVSLNELLLHRIDTIIHNFKKIDSEVLSKSQVTEAGAEDNVYYNYNVLLMRYYNMMYHKLADNDVTYFFCAIKQGCAGIAFNGEELTIIEDGAVLREECKNCLAVVKVQTALTVDEQLILMVKKTSDDYHTLTVKVPEIFANSSITILVYYQVNSMIPGAAECFYHSYDGVQNNNHFWGKAAKTKFYSHIRCEVSGSSHFVITLVDSVKTTLTNLLKSKSYPFEKLSILHAISNAYDEFNSTELPLVAQILSHVSYSKKYVNLEDLTKVISNLQKIDKNVIVGSSTDSILNYTDIIIQNNIHSYDNFLNIADDFIIVVKHVKNAGFSGLVLLNDKIQILNGSVTTEDLLKFEHFYSALVLSPELKQQIEEETNDTKIAIKVFLKNSLFNAEDNNQINSIIFDVLLSDNITTFKGPISVYHRPDKQKSRKVCAYWSYDASRNVSGFWKEDHGAKKGSPLIQCDYFQSRNFACFSDQNVTNNLDEILKSDDPPNEILETLTNLSSNYHQFNSKDVVLVGQVFKKISDSDNVSLESLSEVVSNLQKIDRAVLEKSQDNDNGTDIILHYIQVIMKNQEYVPGMQPIKTDNFVAYITDLNDTNFCSLVLFENGSVGILNNSVKPEDLHKNVSSAIILTPELKNQITTDTQDTKVIVNVFFKDVLFNEKGSTQTKQVSKIFDLLLPDFSGNLSGPIQVFHKLEGTNQNCSHWDYNVPANISGFWQFDNKALEFGSFVVCKFWHATHFAQLFFPEGTYSKILDWFTYVTILSASCYTLIMVFAVVNKFWRKRVENKILFNFVLCGLCLTVAFYMSSGFSDRSLCLVLGFILHYFVLAQFSWMLVIAFFQYQRFVLILPRQYTHIVLKTCLVGWVCPIVIPVTTVLVSGTGCYTEIGGLCYLSGLELYLAIWLPGAVVIVSNIIIFSFIVYKICFDKLPFVRFGGTEATYHTRLFIFLFFDLGLIWVFGFFTKFNVVPAVIFDILVSSQGCVIFLFFVILNKNIKQGLKRRN